MSEEKKKSFAKSIKVHHMLLAIPFVVLVTTVSACTGFNKLFDHGNNSQVVVTPKITEGQEEGNFIGLYDNESMDVEVNNHKKMFTFSKSLLSTVKEFEKNDAISFTYKLDKNEQFIITSVSLKSKAEKDDVQFTFNSADEPKETKEKKQENETKSFVHPLGFTYQPIDTIDLKGDNFVSEENEDYYVTIVEENKNSEIKKLRWSAADELNQISRFKELKGDNRPDVFADAEFVFTSSSKDYKKTIAVTYIDDHLIKYTLTFPKKGNTEKDFYTLIHSFSYEDE